MMLNIFIRNDFVKKLVLCALFLQVVNGFPSDRSDKTLKVDEKQYANGTVIGKYSYMDKEGNPIQVKYYADDSSYGVELNSFKIVSQNNNRPTDTGMNKMVEKSNENIEKPSKEGSPDTAAKDGAFVFDETFKNPAQATNKYDTKPNYPEYNKYGSDTKNSHKKMKYKSSDFEVYAKKDDSPQQCGKGNEKYHVYNFVTDARRARKVPVEEEEGQFCEI